MRRFGRPVLCALSLITCSAGAALAQASPSTLLEQARAAAGSGRAIDALAALAAATEAAPPDPAAFIARARLLDELGHFDLAAEDYRVAARLMPNDAGLQGALCLDLSLANHDLDGALAACNAAVARDTDGIEALSVRGYLQLRRGAWTQAETDFSEVLMRAPADPNATFGRGLALIHLGRGREGNDEISIAVLAAPTLVSEWQARGFGAKGEILPGGQARAEAEELKAALEGLRKRAAKK